MPGKPTGGTALESAIPPAITRCSARSSATGDQVVEGRGDLPGVRATDRASDGTADEAPEYEDEPSDEATDSGTHGAAVVDAPKPLAPQLVRGARGIDLMQRERVAVPADRGRDRNRLTFDGERNRLDCLTGVERLSG